MSPERKAEILDLLIEAADAIRRGHPHTATRSSRQAHELIKAWLDEHEAADFIRPLAVVA